MPHTFVTGLFIRSLIVLPIAMSNQNPTPIRVADLSEANYVPRNTITPIGKAYASSSKPRVSKVLDESESQYVWNKQSNHTNGLAYAGEMGAPTTKWTTEHVAISVSCPTEPFEKNAANANQVQPATERFTLAGHDSRTSEHSNLNEMRAQFALETEQEVALLKPVTIAEASAENDADSYVADYFEDVFSSSMTMERPETTHVWGLDYHIVDMAQTLDYLEQVIYARRPSYAVTANLNYAMLCAKNPRLAAFTKNSALTLCDGMPPLWRSKLNSSKLPERVAGSDLIYRLTERCANKKLRVYFYGASQGVAEKTASTLKNLYPKLIVAGVQCPPFQACSSEEIQSQIARIKHSKPDLLFVALGQPKGEFWIEDHLEELNIPLTIQLGASFDFVAGNATRAPKVMQKLGMEWFYRALKDPVRLAPRYLSNFVFLLKAIRRELIEKLS
jgi:N-acetylglucosaminyldiphosphoundecaprenol N-acetyl-beta-D-mannosaminyltransferase